MCGKYINRSRTIKNKGTKHWFKFNEFNETAFYCKFNKGLLT